MNHSARLATTTGLGLALAVATAAPALAGNAPLAASGLSTGAQHGALHAHPAATWSFGAPAAKLLLMRKPLPNMLKMAPTL
jgi:hypothetical protein